MTDKNIVLVVARYHEDLEWLKDEPFNKYNVIIYNKGDNDNFYKPRKLIKISNLANVGGCIHTYFYHIITHYDTLHDIVVFLPGSCMDEHVYNFVKKEQTLKTIKQMEETNNSVFVIQAHSVKPINKLIYNFHMEDYRNNNEQNFEKNSDTKLKLCSIRPFGKWYQTCFKNIDIYDISYKSIFALTKEHIRNRSLNSYMNLFTYVCTDKNEESGHYFERSFLSVFHPIPENCLIKKTMNRKTEINNALL